MIGLLHQDYGVDPSRKAKAKTSIVLLNRSIYWFITTLLKKGSKLGSLALRVVAPSENRVNIADPAVLPPQDRPLILGANLVHCGMAKCRKRQICAVTCSKTI